MAAGQIAHRENCGSGQLGYAWQLCGSSYSEQVVMRGSVVRLGFEGARLQPRRNCRQVEGTAVTRDEAWTLANHWVAAWNAHDLDLIMTHYDDAIELISPVAARLLGTPNLRAYFQRGLEAYPELHFRLEDVLWGINSVVLYYTNQKGTRTAEFMELSAIGKVARVVT